MAANVCSTNPVATVIAIQGEAYARNAIGQMRKLFVGDVLLEGETIVTMPGGHVELGFTDGKKLAVLPHEGFNMTAESLGLAKIGEATEADKELAMQNAKAAAKKAASEAALQSGEIEQLVKAIEQGGAIDEQLEATAAGLGGGGESEGHDFVRLPRIIEDVTPVSYGWGPIGGGVLPPNPASDINLPPEADPDAQSLGEDTPSVSGNVISGLNSILVGSDDTDPDFDPLTVSAVSFGSRTGTIGAPIAGVWGTLVLNGDGSYTYTPNAHAQTLGVGKTGVDVFDYTVRDPAGATDSTTLTLTVVGSNDAPIPYTIPGDPDKPPVRDPNTDPTTGHYLHIIPEDTSVSGIVKATDVDGDPLTFTQNTQPSHGTAVVNPDGSYTYTPFQDYNGNDSFTVLVNDGNGGTAIAVVDIIITPVQDPSIITPGYGTVIEDTVLSTSGQLSITDVDGPQDQAFVPQSNVPGAHGSFSIDNNGNWVYNLNNSDPAVQALNLGDTLTETFTVNGVDGTPSTVTVTIQGVPENVAPNANDDSVSTTVNTPVPVAVLSNDDDPDGDPLTIQSFQPTTPNGTINQVGNQLVYTPNPGYTGTDTFTYTISDGRGGTDTATVTVSIGNAPVTPTVSVSNSVVPESTPYAEFTVSLSSPSTSDITVNLVLADNTAQGGGVDYGAVGPTNIQVFSGGTWQNRTTATFLAGETTILVRTPITSDTTDEPNETYTLTANVVSGTTTNPSATGTGTILDDDGAPSLSIIGPATVNEAIGTVVYTVTLTGSTATPVTVNYGTTPGTAESGQDYTPTSGTLTFAAGQTVAYVTVPVLNDTPPVYEGPETYTVNLSGATNAGITTPTATTTIVDDGTGTPPSTGTPDDDRPVLSVSDVTVTEGVQTHAVFTVSLSNASDVATTVSLATTDGTALDGVGDPVGPGVPDYNPTLAYSTNGGATWVTGSTATIAAGATSLLVRSAITDDNAAESTEAFTLTATRTSGVTTNLSDVGTGTIIDNDINTVPTAQTTQEDIARAFSTANGNPIVVSSPTGANVTTVLTLTSGTLTLTAAAGATITNNGTGSVTVSGTAAAVNAALEGATFRPVGDLHSTTTPVTMTVQSTSAGITDTDTVSISVTPVVDPATLYLHATRLGSGTLFNETFTDPNNWDNPNWFTQNLTANSFVGSADPAPGWDGETSQTEWNGSWHSPTAPGGRAHYHTSASGTNDGTDDAYGFKAYYDPNSAGATQYVYSGNIQFGGPNAGGAGLVFGYQDDQNYYVVRLNKPTIAGNTGEDNAHPGTADRLELVRMTAGVPTVLGSADGFTPGTNPWDLVIVVDATGIRVSAAGGGDSATISYTGGAGPALAEFGMYTYDNDNGVSYDNILVHNNRVSFTTVANLNDIDGSETLAANVTLSNIPASALLLDSVGNLVTVTGGTATVAANTTVTMLTAASLTDAEIRAVTSSIVVTETGPTTATSTAAALLDLNGTTGADTLTGTTLGDWINGQAGNDTINAGTGADVIIGGAGNDALNGGADAVVDTFRWNAGETGADTITGFGSAAGTDRLDLRDLLVGETHGNNDIGNLANYLSFVQVSATSSRLDIRSSGSGAVTQQITFTDVDLTNGNTLTSAQIIQNLINNNKLICD